MICDLREVAYRWLAAHTPLAIWALLVEAAVFLGYAALWGGWLAWSTGAVFLAAAPLLLVGVERRANRDARKALAAARHLGVPS